MIINLSNFGGGGGGGSYVLPIASQSTLGGVKIGSGVNIDKSGTISVSGSDVSNYAMALKSIQEGDENDFRVVNNGGWLYYVQEEKYTTENIFVKVKYDVDYVTIDMDIDGQTDTDIFEISNGDFSFAISIDEEGNLFYVNENDEEVYYNSEVSEYQYGDFTFEWFEDGAQIQFPQQSSPIEANALTDNCEYWGCVGKNVNIANQDRLGLVKIGEGIDLAEDGTISVPTVDPSTIKSVSALPQTAVAGDVVSYNGQMWEYKATSGTSCVINNYKGNNSYGDIVINYYNLPQNQILFDFYLEGWGSHRYVSYNNGVFTLWEDDQMTTSAETITEGSSFVFWSENVFGQAGKGLLSLTSTENSNNNINLIVSIVGTWNEQQAGHWEPGDWNEQVSNAALYKNNMMKSSIFAQVGLGGVVPMQLAQTDSLIDRFFGVVSMESVPAVFQTDSSGFTCNISYLPPNNMDNIRLVNVYLGGYQIEFNFYQDGVMFENKDTDGDWQIVSSGVIHSNTSATTWDSGESYEMTSTFQNNILSVHYTTDVNFDVQNLPVACLKFNDAYNPVRLR